MEDTARSICAESLFHISAFTGFVFLYPVGGDGVADYFCGLSPAVPSVRSYLSENRPESPQNQNLPARDGMPRTIVSFTFVLTSKLFQCA